MSTKSGKKAHRPKGSGRSDKDTWSDWAWEQGRNQFWRARQKSNGEYEYEYQYPQTETPRGETCPADLATLSNKSTPQTNNDYSSGEYTYQDPSQSSVVANNLSVEFTRASLDDHVESSQSASYGHEQSGKEQLDGVSSNEFASTQPIAIPQDVSRSAHDAVTDDYSSSSTSTIIGTQRDSNSLMTTARTSGYVAANESSYYQHTQAPYGSSYSSGYSHLGSSMVGTYGAPMSHAGYSASSRSYTEAQSGTQQTHESSAATSTGINTLKASYMTISGTGGTEEALDPSFKVHKSKAFKPGGVFKVLWFEPQGENTTAQTNATEVTTFSWNIGGNKYGQRAYASIRRFVIVAADHGHCQCLPILTYHRQATKKWGVKRDDHAIVYIGDKPPNEIEGEERLRLRPIRIVPNTPRDKLEKESRINYAKIYTVEHNVKVYFIGSVAPECKHALVADFDTVWNKKRQMIPDPPDYSASTTVDSSLYVPGGYS